MTNFQSAALSLGSLPTISISDHQDHAPRLPSYILTSTGVIINSFLPSSERPTLQGHRWRHNSVHNSIFLQAIFLSRFFSASFSLRFSFIFLFHTGFWLEDEVCVDPPTPTSSLCLLLSAASALLGVTKSGRWRYVCPCDSSHPLTPPWRVMCVTSCE